MTRSLDRLLHCLDAEEKFDGLIENYRDGSESERERTTSRFYQHPSNSGFGPDWDCTAVPKSEPICIKKLGH
jgi:hypothetical protein